MGKRSQSGGDQRGGKRWKGSAKQALSGPAIWATCLRNKEKKAADELIDYLEEIADRIYPNVPADYQPPTSSAPEVYDNSEDEMDAMMNGAPSSSKATTSSSTQPSNEGEVVKSKPKEQELDIESQIQAELAELQGGRIGPKSKAGKEKENGGQKPPKTRRFRSLDTDTECLLFISCAAPYDPYVLVQALLEEVEKTGECRSRFIMRLTPSSETCRVTEMDIEAMAEKILPPFFKAIENGGETSAGKGSETTPMGVETVSKQVRSGATTFKVDVRNRSSDFSRDRLLNIVAGAVPREGGHHADLKNAGRDGLMIVVVILRNVCAISVNANYDRFRKYNMLETAEAVRKDSEEGRVAKGGSKAAAATASGEETKKETEGKED